MISALILLATLAACGADGEPIPPGVTVSGDARVGVVKN
jgi:predicted small lipoprotein YifL